MYTFARWVLTPENRSARAAVERVAACVCAHGWRREINPLVLHGPAGTGKTHLASALVAQVTRECPDLVAAVLTAGDFDHAEEATDALAAARQSDLLVVEDLQHLATRAAEALVQVFDERLARQQQM